MYVDQGCVRATTLPESRGSKITRQGIRIALRLGVVGARFKPGSRRQGYDTSPNFVAEFGFGSTGASIIEHTDDVVGHNISLPGVFGIDDDGSWSLAGYISERTLHLAVQFVAGLGRHHV